MRFSDVIFPLSLAIATVSAGVVDRRADSALQDGRNAQKLNQQFQGLTVSSECMTGEVACVNGQLVQCVGDKFVQVTSATCATPRDTADVVSMHWYPARFAQGFATWYSPLAATAPPTGEDSVDTPSDTPPTADTTDTSPIRRDGDDDAAKIGRE